ncbi:MAG: response regulator [Candidatus Tectimicrobiota bacterium]
MPPLQASHDVPHPYRVLIVDDHPVVREGFMRLVQRQGDLTVCGEAASAQEALEAVAACRPDVLLVDLSLRDSSGLELIKTLQAQDPALPILVLSMYDEALYAERARRAGARGYIMKHEATSKLLEAIYQVLRPEPARPAGSAERQTAPAGPPAAVSPLDCLSDREMEVLHMLGQGHNRHAIAAALNLSVKTIETHRAHIMAKLQLKTVNEVVRFAVRWLHEQGAS